MDISSCNSTGRGFMTSSTSGACATDAPGRGDHAHHISRMFLHQKLTVKRMLLLQAAETAGGAADLNRCTTHRQLLPSLRPVHASQHDHTKVQCALGYRSQASLLAVGHSERTS